MRTYSELIELDDFFARFEYLRIGSHLGDETFGSKRYLNQDFYASREWKHARDLVILRDEGCDLGVLDRQITEKLIVHHMNPVTKEQVLDGDPAILDPEYLISCSLMTHNAIHYGDDRLLIKDYAPRRANDTCPWR